MNGYVSTKDLHSEEVKVRLREIPHAELLLLAEQKDIPPAVLARQLVMEGLRRYREEQQKAHYSSALSA